MTSGGSSPRDDRSKPARQTRAIASSSPGRAARTAKADGSQQVTAPEPRRTRTRVSVVVDRIEHMIETVAGSGAGGVDDLTASDLLALARDRKTAEDRAAADLLVVAARWADLHPPESIHDAAAFTVPGS